MSVSSARRVRAAAPPALAALLVGLLVAGCSGDRGGGAGGASASSSPTPTTLADLGAGLGSGRDVADVEVPRLEFCGLVPDDAVTAALGAEPGSGDAREPGEPDAPSGDAPRGEALREVGCTWTAGATTARAWVFAQPVGEAAAERVVAEARSREGCRVDSPAGSGTTTYGDPSLRQTCRVEGGQRVRWAGRFGDTWLTCELQGPGAAERAETWCVSVLRSLDPGA